MRVSALGIGLSLIFIGCTSFVHPPRVPHQRSSSSYDTNRCGIVGRRSPPATSSVSHIRSVEATAGGVVPDVYILSEVLAGVVVAASEAGAHMKAKIGADVLKTKFNPKDLLTEVDSECQGIIERVMSHEFPEHALLGEESVEPGSEASAAALQHALANPGGEESDGADWLWIVDPIDGTTNFVHGMPLSAVSIGVAYRGQVVVGEVKVVFGSRPMKAHGRFLSCSGCGILELELHKITMPMVWWIAPQVLCSLSRYEGRSRSFLDGFSEIVVVGVVP